MDTTSSGARILDIFFHLHHYTLDGRDGTVIPGRRFVDMAPVNAWRSRLPSLICSPGAAWFARTYLRGVRAAWQYSLHA